MGGVRGRGEGRGGRGDYAIRREPSMTIFGTTTVSKTFAKKCGTTCKLHRGPYCAKKKRYST